MGQMNPAAQAIGIFPQFIAQQPETLVLNEKGLSLSGDSFSVKLANGTPLLQVEGKVISMNGRKVVRDMAGNHLFNIFKEHFHLHATFVVEDPKGKKLLEVKNNISPIGSRAHATFTSSNGKEECWEMEGNWRGKSAAIRDISQRNFLVARIDRNSTLDAKHLFLGQQTYAVEVAPGVDMALIAAMCICFDEKNNEHSGGGSGG